MSSARSADLAAFLTRPRQGNVVGQQSITAAFANSGSRRGGPTVTGQLESSRRERTEQDYGELRQHPQWIPTSTVRAGRDAVLRGWTTTVSPRRDDGSGDSEDELPEPIAANTTQRHARAADGMDVEPSGSSIAAMFSTVARDSVDAARWRAMAAKPKKNGGRRAWCFTKFFSIPREEEGKQFPGVLELQMAKRWTWPQPWPELRYGIAQLERSPTTGRTHLQGYLELSKPCKLPHVQAKLGPGTHLEARAGTREQARDYCRKLDTRIQGFEPLEFGDWEAGGQGTRNDVRHLIAAAHEPWRELLERDPEALSAHLPLVRLARSLGTAPREKPTELVILAGVAGAGKSWMARKAWPGAYYRTLPTHAKGPQWWDGYDGEKVIVWEDWRPWMLPLEHMLVIADASPLKLPVKGGFEHIRAEKVVLTTNEMTPLMCYGGDAAWQRRITCLIMFNQEWDPTCGPHPSFWTCTYGKVPKEISEICCDPQCQPAEKKNDDDEKYASHTQDM